jgi:NAD+ synthase
VSARPLGPHVLDLDLATEVDRISAWMVDAVANQLHRRGVIIAMSGGIDSSVCAALAVRAFGTGKVFGILLPERDSSHKSADRGALVADHLGVTYELQDIAPALAAIGCYRQRDEAIRRVFPDYADDWKCKLAISGGAKGGINFFKLIVQSPDGTTTEGRLGLKEYLQIVAATNFKQRPARCSITTMPTGSTMRCAERRTGSSMTRASSSRTATVPPTSSRSRISTRRRSTRWRGTSGSPRRSERGCLAQGQDEFYFALPYHQMDLALWAHNQGLPAADVAAGLGISEEHAKFIYTDIEAKRRTTHYLHARPILVEPVTEVHG